VNEMLPDDNAPDEDKKDITESQKYDKGDKK
jgi:hypothetical protein